MKLISNFRWSILIFVAVLVVLGLVHFFQYYTNVISPSVYSNLQVVQIKQKLSSKKLSPQEQVALMLMLQSKTDSRNMDSIVLLGKQVLEIAGSLGDSNSIANALLPIRGNLDFNDQKLIKPYFPGAIAVLKRQNNLYGAARLSASYGVIVLHEGNASIAQSYLLYALKTLEQVDSLHKGVNISLNLGSSYALLGRLKQSNHYYDYAIQLATKYHDSTGLASALMNRGTYFADEVKNYQLAIKAFQDAANVIPAHAGYLRLMNKYNLALALIHAGDLNDGQNMLEELLNEFKATNATEGIAMTDKGLGEIAALRRDFKGAKKYLLHAIQLFDEMGVDIESFNTRKQLRDVYVEMSDYDAASKLSIELEKRNASIFSVEKTKAFADISEKYASEKRQLQIQRLESESMYQKIGLFFLLIVSVAFYFLFRYQRRIVREKHLSYSVLMKQYRSDQKAKFVSQNPISEDIVSQDLFLRLCDYYEKEKPYLNAKLKANTIALKMHVRSREISSLLKSKGYNGFNEFTNRFRVEEVKSRLADPNMAHLKIEAIALDAGFGSKQSFYSAFEEYTGLNPSYYREEIFKN
jgi:AraC-like DNA-binding protein